MASPTQPERERPLVPVGSHLEDAGPRAPGELGSEVVTFTQVPRAIILWLVAITLWVAVISLWAIVITRWVIVITLWESTTTQWESTPTQWEIAIARVPRAVSP